MAPVRRSSAAAGDTCALFWGFLAEWVERVTGIEPALSAWEVCGAVALPPADFVTCGDLGGLSLSYRGYPRALLLSGTQRARFEDEQHRRQRDQQSAVVAIRSAG